LDRGRVVSICDAVRAVRLGSWVSVGCVSLSVERVLIGSGAMRTERFGEGVV